MSELRVIESRGKSIDEAIFKGLQQLGVSIDEVTIETVQAGSKGILGIGSKPCIVRLSERPIDYMLQEEEPAKAEKPQRSERREKAPQPARREESTEPVEFSQILRESKENKENRENKEKQESPRAAAPQREARDDRGNRGSSNRSRGARGSRGGSGREQASRAVPKDDTVYTPYVPGESSCDGAEFLSGLLEQMGVKSTLGFAETPEAVKFHIDSNSMGILIGHRGETLDAMQYLTGLVINRGKENYRRVTLDTENYRSKRAETLTRLARRLAAQVRNSGESVKLEPMNPYERRILHSTLQGNPYVETHSEGEEPNRCVVITPKGRE